MRAAKRAAGLAQLVLAFPEDRGAYVIDRDDE